MNGNMKNSCKIWVKVCEGKRPLGRAVIKTDQKDVKVLTGFKYEHGKRWGSRRLSAS
jgi:hypothetical protein